MGLNTLQRGLPPHDIMGAYGIIDGLTGTRAATLDVLTDRRWPGGEMAGVGARQLDPIRLAQASTGTVNDFGPTIPGLAMPKGRHARPTAGSGPRPRSVRTSEAAA